MTLSPMAALMGQGDRDEGTFLSCDVAGRAVKPRPTTAGSRFNSKAGEGEKWFLLILSHELAVWSEVSGPKMRG